MRFARRYRVPSEPIAAASSAAEAGRCGALDCRGSVLGSRCYLGQRSSGLERVADALTERRSDVGSGGSFSRLSPPQRVGPPFVVPMNPANHCPMMRFSLLRNARRTRHFVQRQAFARARVSNLHRETAKIFGVCFRQA